MRGRPVLSQRAGTHVSQRERAAPGRGFPAVCFFSINNAAPILRCVEVGSLRVLCVFLDDSPIENRQSPRRHQLGKLPLALRGFIWYKQFVESSVWLAGRICATLVARPASKLITGKTWNCPGHGVLIRGQSSSKGFGVRRKNLQVIFFQAASFRLGSCREGMTFPCGRWVSSRLCSSRVPPSGTSCRSSPL